MVAEEVDFSALVRTVIEDIEVQADQNRQTIDLSQIDDNICVMGFPLGLKQAVANIVANALKYTPVDGNISIRVQRQGNVMVFEVADTGYGIPESEQATIFQPFERATTPETKMIEGTGLGLHIVKTVIEHNKGEIVFASEYGTGSLFGFKLPLAEQEAS